jgi:hypothetical protein
MIALTTNTALAQNRAESARHDPFTLDGSGELENQIARICQDTRAGVQSLVPAAKLGAILLGGGYGRGEGGVRETPAGDRPYNDLEFYVCLRGNDWLNERRYGEGIRALAEELSPGAGVEVELKLFSLGKLRRSPVSMFYYDLVMGHRWILGGEKLLIGCEHHRDAHRIPLSEATRLLMNRCSGLLFAQERLQREPFTPDDADFVARNLAKAQLAFGDVVLTAYGRYHWSCRERHQRLRGLKAGEDLPWLPEALAHHFAGLNFKLHPRRTTLPAATLETQHQQLKTLALQVWLWLESRRLHQAFASARDYALSTINKCSETSLCRSGLVNFGTFGPGVLFTSKAVTYPRMRLLHALSLLLFDDAALSDPGLRKRLQSELRTRATTFGDCVASYETLWRRFR